MRRRLTPGRWRIRAALPLALVLGGALALSGCGADSAPEANPDPAAEAAGEITFWDNNGGPNRTPIWEQIIADFHRAYPKITVKYTGVPIAQVQQKYDTAIQTGGVPDVGGVSSAYLSTLVAQRALEPLDDRLDKSDALKGNLTAGFLTTLRETVGDNKLYEIPTSGNMEVFWYRKDWLGQAGVQPPKTWPEFFDAAGKLTDKPKNKFGYTIRGGAGSSFHVLSEMYAYSGVDRFFDEAGKSTINDPKNVEAVEKIAALYNKQTPAADVNNDYPKMVAQFGGGSVAIMHHNLGSYADHSKAFGKDNVASIPMLPSATGNSVYVSNPIDGLSVFKGSKNKEAAWKFVEFVASEQANGLWCQKIGQIPANTKVLNADWIKDQQPLSDALKLLGDGKNKVIAPPWHLPELNAINKNDMEPLYQKVLLGQLPAKQFLDQWAGKMTEAQAKYQKRTGK